MARVVLAMSGGVDSSVAAHLLQERGHEVIGLFMRHGEESAASCNVPAAPGSSLPILHERLDHKQGCCSAADAADARSVAARLGIPFYALDLQSDFRRIVDYFVDEYRRGRTPNPCVQCNNWIKFGRLFGYADAVQAEFVATGHYARLLPHDDAKEIGLHRGVDDGKDQAYVLAGIDRSLLRRMLLPIGEYRKADIRSIAESLGLRVADKRDSQEICFVTSGHHGDFVRARREGSTAGKIVTTDGRVVGSHPGIEQFTIGQRKGLGVAMGEPYFVVQIDPERCEVIIGKADQLACRSLIASDVNWLIDSGEWEEHRAMVQIRYNASPQKASVRKLENQKIDVIFDAPCYGVAAGQLAVVFEGDRVLAGGWIDSTSPN